MKKITKLFIEVLLILSILLSVCNFVYADITPTLEQIKNVFNACETVEKYNADLSTMNMLAAVEGSNLTITVTEGSTITNIVYTLSGNVLTTEYTEGVSRKRDLLPIVTNIVVDCIEQFHGYQDGQMFNTLNSGEVEKTYTLETQGLKINQTRNVYQAQIDISKVIPAIDVNLTITVADFDTQKDKMTGEGEVRVAKGNVRVYKTTVNGIDYITVGEKGNFSKPADAAIDSAMTVFFGSNAKFNYFKENFPNISAGNVQCEGIKVEINPTLTPAEEFEYGRKLEYNIVRITVDKGAVDEALKTQTQKEKEEENATGGDSSRGESGSVTEKGKLPKTGGELNRGMIALYVIMSVAGVGIIIMAANSKKQK